MPGSHRAIDRRNRLGPVVETRGENELLLYMHVFPTAPEDICLQGKEI